MNCIDNLKNCKAECCKYFVIMVDKDISENKFKDCFYFNVNKLDDDMYRYFSLHENLAISPDRKVIIITKPTKCKKVGTKLYIYSRCRNLNKDNMCDGYETRPNICKTGYTETCNNLDKPEKCIY